MARQSRNGLTLQQERFCAEYLVDFNATAAYTRSSYKAHGNRAEVNASKLRSNTKVQAKLRELLNPILEKTLIRAEKLLVVFLVQVDPPSSYASARR
jgi:phage terminase small subunit